MIKKGDIVKYKNGLYKDEIGIQYIVIEVNGDRCIIEFLCELPIPPRSVAVTNELEKVQK